MKTLSRLYVQSWIKIKKNKKVNTKSKKLARTKRREIFPRNHYQQKLWIGKERNQIKWKKLSSTKARAKWKYWNLGIPKRISRNIEHSKLHEFIEDGKICFIPIHLKHCQIKKCIERKNRRKEMKSQSKHQNIENL